MKACSITICFVVLLASIVHAAVINVPTAQYPTIQAGIDSALAGDTVLVQPGTYLENISINDENITVGSLFLTTKDKSYIHRTIMDGSRYRTVVYFGGGLDSTAVLCGFTITNGSGGCDGWNNCSGGGISCFSNPTLSDLRIIGNKATVGGGMYIINANPKLVNVTITENSALKGGGIYFGKAARLGRYNPAEDSRPEFDTVNRCNIYQNYALTGSDLYSSNDTLFPKISLDTFTVISPTGFHASPEGNFTETRKMTMVH